MAIVHLLRHGHVHNPDGVLYGRLPEFRLSDAGQAMAAAAAEHLKSAGHDVARVVSSPLLRARQTAQHVADAFGLDVEVDERVIEAGNAYEGTKIGHGAAHYAHPRHWWRLRNPWKPSWGEPYRQQRERMVAAVLDAARQQPDRETVIVSHQLPIWVARRAAEGKGFLHDPRTRNCDLASVTTLSVDGDRIALAGYADPAAHVERP